MTIISEKSVSLIQFLYLCAGKVVRQNFFRLKSFGRHDRRAYLAKAHTVPPAAAGKDKTFH